MIILRPPYKNPGSATVLVQSEQLPPYLGPS